MRNILKVLGAILFLASIYFVLLDSFPIYAYLIPSIVSVLALDGYLWISIRRHLDHLKPGIRFLLIGLYLFPLLSFLIVFILGFFIPFISWNIVFRTYTMAFVSLSYGCKMIPALFHLLNDLIRAIKTIILAVSRKTWKLPMQPGYPWLRKSGWYLSIPFVLILLWGMIFGLYDFRVKEATINLPELPPSFDGIRIVQVSDIHLGSWVSTAKLEKAVEMINSLHPDLIFFTGDLVNYSSTEAYQYANILKKVRSKQGIFAILGNHDYSDYVSWKTKEAKEKDFNYLKEIYGYLGWKLLLNDHFVLRSGIDSIAIIGVQNWGRSKRFPKLGDMDKALKGIESMDIQLLLSHDPSHWDSVVIKNNKGIDVTFSGHTHGFQLGIDCCGIKWSPSQYMYKEWAGLYESPVEGSHPQYLYVNSGLGTIGYPGRIGILPEITLITLKK
ncbi:MAG: metallophosphoesterase [Bacteroidota bacterium]